MARHYVVISGLPGSGKSTLAQALAKAMSLRLLDKDNIFERILESKGCGDADWRRKLSRESDLALAAQAVAEIVESIRQIADFGIFTLGPLLSSYISNARSGGLAPCNSKCVPGSC